MIELNGSFATPQEAMAISGRSRKFVYQAILNDRIFVHRFGRFILIPEKEVDKLKLITINRKEMNKRAKDFKD